MRSTSTLARSRRTRAVRLSKGSGRIQAVVRRAVPSCAAGRECMRPRPWEQGLPARLQVPSSPLVACRQAQPSQTLASLLAGKGLARRPIEPLLAGKQIAPLRTATCLAGKLERGTAPRRSLPASRSEPPPPARACRQGQWQHPGFAGGPQCGSAHHQRSPAADHRSGTQNAPTN